ncbi:tail fiber assembly protein [Citrobacter amalonaticus]|uniref:tail fiber assembly protein n=1 Tax=Citrobacter amalonaticus TaxID=35703 RepID=UPI003AAEA80B
MNQVYSPSENIFYAVEYKASYLTSGSWPPDAVNVSDEIFAEFTGTPPTGKMMVSGGDGLPAWGDIPSPSIDDIIADNERTKLQLRAIADSEIEWRQDAVDTELATEEETAELVEWKKYRVLLMRVDTAAPEWPTPPGQEAS